MTDSTPVPRLPAICFPYELIAGDLLINGGGTTRRVESTSGASTVTVTFDDATTQDFPLRAFLEIYRDQSALPAAFADIPPTIVA